MREMRHGTEADWSLDGEPSGHGRNWLDVGRSQEERVGAAGIFRTCDGNFPCLAVDGHDEAEMRVG